MTHSSPQSTRKSIRHEMRRKRSALTKQRQNANANAVKRQILRSGLLNCCASTAVYFSCNGELDTGPLILALYSMGKIVSLPTIKPANKMEFRIPNAQYRLSNNTYGIPEPDPDTSRLRPLWTHSVMFMPLLAFDDKGNRIGMGGGYYDRALSTFHNRPLCIGLAHDLQYFKGIPTQAWDETMDAVITENSIWAFSKKAAIALGTKIHH